MDDDPRLAKALARYQVVSAFVAATLNRGQRRAFLEHLARRTWTGADGEPMRIEAETIRSWIRRYRRGGFEALFDKDRPSPGVQAIPPDLVEIACALKQHVPERTLDTLIRVMEDLGHAPPGLVRRSTLHRALQVRGLSHRPLSPGSTEDLDRWEAAHPNDLWQSDMRSGPWLPDPNKPGKVRRAWLFAFLDDHSRLVLDARFSFKEDLPALELCLRRAIQKWGVPNRCYYDNGQVYRAHHMRAICAWLDIKHPVFTTIDRPEGHGKIEALNKLLLNNFIAEVKASTIQTIEELNEALWAWLDTQYQNVPHGETGEAPLVRWRAGIDRIRYADEEALRIAFLWSERRTADKAGVFSLFGIRYQSARFRRRKVEVRFDPEALHEVELWDQGKFAERVRPLEVHPWRRPKKPAAASERPAAGPAVDDNWLGHLVKRRRAEQVSEPDPRAWKREADQRREANTEGLLHVLRERLDPHVVDETEIRGWAARFGPVDLETFGARLDALLERFPRDLHVRIYLDTIHNRETP